MIILGDLSGIQRYIFDVSEAGGGQARRLRARSFLVQALAECSALRVLEAMDWPFTQDHFLFSGAGKFILRGAGAAAHIPRLCEELNRELLQESAGELRLALAAGTGGNDVNDYRQAQFELQRRKAAPWQPTAGWNPSRLVLAPLNTPCALCRRTTATEQEFDSERKETRLICRHCARTYQIGRELPCARTLVLREGDTGDFTWHGLSGKLQAINRAETTEPPHAVIGFDNEAPPPGCPSDRYINRRLMANVPVDSHNIPVWFTELAKRSTGDHLLAVLKADVDSLGVQIEQRLSGHTELTEFLDFAKDLDAFFTEELRQEIAGNPKWDSIYTVFAGGDDLVMIGPWDVMFRFAGRMRELFGQRFPALTLSAGLALFKPKRPIKTVMEQAERLLEQAKQSPKDQCAALGQVWNWQQHALILREAERLAGWVWANQMQRGWLHTLLELNVARHGDNPEPLATARFAYHVNRNYRRNTEARHWGDNLVRRFDDANQPEVRYLPAIVRHALTATRTAGEGE